LNRPRAIHALTLDMVRAMTGALLDWRGDDRVRAVLIDHAVDAGGDPKLSRGFCSGGDISLLRQSALEDGVAGRRSFTRNISSTTCSLPIPSRWWRSWTALRWAEA
jgi:enoyl-CoA hydratase